VSLDEFAEQSGCVFAESAVVGTKSSEEMRVDVEFSGDFAVNEDRDDDFGFGLERAGEIAGVRVYVAHDNGLAGGGGRAADALMERNARVGRHTAFERTEDEHVTVAFLFEHVKANPVIASKFLVEERDDALHEGVGGSGGDSEAIQ